MISLFKRKQHKPPAPAKVEQAQAHAELSTPTLLPGSEGEHLLQNKYGTRQRALKFYDRQVLNHLSPVMQEFIPRQQVMFVATSDSHGECDCSSRFGVPGFVQVIDPHFLIYPEYRGNGVLASQGNILENPHIGLIFVDFFETTVGLHVNGAARIVENDQLLKSRDNLPEGILSELKQEGKKRPERWIMVEVEEAYIHCSKHVPLLKKLDKQIDWGTDDMAAKGGDFFRIGQLSPYERMGGDEAMKKIVDKVYRKIMADPETGPVFETMDIITLIERFKAFLGMTFGSKNDLFNSTDIRSAYQHLLNSGLTEDGTDRLIEYLGSSLNELEVPENDIETITAKLETIKEEITTFYIGCRINIRS